VILLVGDRATSPADDGLFFLYTIRRCFVISLSSYLLQLASLSPHIYVREPILVALWFVLSGGFEQETMAFTNVSSPSTAALSRLQYVLFSFHFPSDAFILLFFFHLYMSHNDPWSWTSSGFCWVSLRNYSCQILHNPLFECDLLTKHVHVKSLMIHCVIFSN